MSKARELANLGNAYSDGALSNRNMVINGSLLVSQRGDFTTAQTGYDSAYTVDRWNNNGNINNYKQHLKDVTVDGMVVNAFRMEAGLTYTGFMQSFQRIEDYKLLTGQVITISMWMRSNTTNARFYWYDGTSTFSSGHSGSGQWEKLTLTLTVSATISDYPYVIPCLNDETQSIAIQQGDYFEFTMVQVELGDTATPFEHRSYGDELARCQRYYYRSDGIYRDAGVTTSGYMTTEWALPVQMRAVGTAQVFGYPSGTSGRVSYFTGTWNDTASFSFPHIGPNYFSIQYNNVTASQMGLSFTIDAEL